MRACAECGNFDTDDTCRICRNPDRDQTRICVVEDVADLWAMERAGVFRDAIMFRRVMSAIDGIGPDQLRIGYLVEKVTNGAVAEVI